jgi:hypothetical protein
MIKIEVQPGVRTITSKAGKPFRIATAYAATLDQQGQPNKYPQRFEFILGRDDPEPAPGLYTLAPASIYVNDRGNLAIAPKLVPVPSR